MTIGIWDYGSSPELADNNVTNIQIVEGNAVTTSEQFLDATGAPLLPNSGYPIATITDGQSLITQGLAYYKTQQPDGTWFSDLTIPEGFDFNGQPQKVLTLTWICITPTTTLQSSLLITVLPKDSATELLDDKEITVLGPVNSINAVIPYIVNLNAGDSVNYAIYDGNQQLVSAVAPTATQQGPVSIVTLPVTTVRGLMSRLRPFNLILTITLANGSFTRQVFTTLRIINPSILSAMQSLEMAINKANQVETIKGLQYRESDLLEALTRGLDYFNNVPPSLTSFTGIDMRGSLREGWLVCSSTRALRAQLQAEGLFNFDFSGQNVSLNVDRTAAVEAACTYYEGLIESEIRPLKMLLGKKGIINGDGSMGDRLALVSQMGVTRISNTSITRSRLGNALHPSGWLQ